MSNPDLNEQPAACPPLADTTGSEKWVNQLADTILDGMENDRMRTGTGAPDNPYRPNWNQVAKWVRTALRRYPPPNNDSATTG